MEIDISWVSLGKIAAVGIFTYLVSPLFMIVRDTILWGFIRKFLVGAKVKQLVGSYAHSRVQYLLAQQVTFRMDYKTKKYYLNDNEVPKEAWISQKNEVENLATVCAQQKEEIDSREQLVNRWLKHYKLIEVNPITELRMQLCLHFEEIHGIKT